VTPGRRVGARRLVRRALLGHAAAPDGRGRHHVDYRYVVDTLVRKPGGFRDYRYRDDLFPTTPSAAPGRSWTGACRPGGPIGVPARPEARRHDPGGRRRAGAGRRARGGEPWDDRTIAARVQPAVGAPPALATGAVDLAAYDALLGDQRRPTMTPPETPPLERVRVQCRALGLRRCRGRRGAGRHGRARELVAGAFAAELLGHELEGRRQHRIARLGQEARLRPARRWPRSTSSACRCASAGSWPELCAASSSTGRQHPAVRLAGPREDARRGRRRPRAGPAGPAGAVHADLRPHRPPLRAKRDLELERELRGDVVEHDGERSRRQQLALQLQVALGAQEAAMRA